MLSVGILTYTAALAIIPYNTSRSMHIPDLYFALYHLSHLTLPVAVFIFHGKLCVNTCSVELPGGGVHAMNNFVLTKWRRTLSINIGVLENH